MPVLPDCGNEGCALCQAGRTAISVCPGWSCAVRTVWVMVLTWLPATCCAVLLSLCAILLLFMSSISTSTSTSIHHLPVNRPHKQPVLDQHLRRSIVTDNQADMPLHAEAPLSVALISKQDGKHIHQLAGPACCQQHACKLLTSTSLPWQVRSHGASRPDSNTCQPQGLCTMPPSQLAVH